MSGLDVGVETQAPAAPSAPRLDELEAVFRRVQGTKRAANEVVAAAREAATAVAAAELEADGEEELLARLVFLADLLSGLALEDPWSPPEVEALVDGAASVMQAPPELIRPAVALRAIRDPRLLEPPPRLAIEVQLKLLAALTSAPELSFWVGSSLERLSCVFRDGNGTGGETAREAALRAIREHPRAAGDGHDEVHTVPVLRSQRPRGAIVMRTQAGREAWSLALARETAAMLGLVLEKDALLQETPAKERALIESTERRLTRLGFDLHDGAIQDIAALASDVRLFREQLDRLLADDQHHDRVLGRVDDLEARLRAVDADLRELARSFDSPSVLRKPFDEALRGEVRAFEAKSQASASLTLEGDFEPLTPSQRIALLRIVQEALTNVREHSRASEVRISVIGKRGHVHAEITDNGCGFDVERTLIQAAKNGRLGLVGMSERVRLLGGTFDVESSPGGPTTISVTLPEWRPVTGASAAV